MRPDCNHSFTPLFRAPFHNTPGAAWAVEYCRCGARQDHCINPKAHQPIDEDQPK